MQASLSQRFSHCSNWTSHTTEYYLVRILLSVQLQQVFFEQCYQAGQHTNKIILLVAWNSHCLPESLAEQSNKVLIVSDITRLLFYFTLRVVNNEFSISAANFRFKYWPHANACYSCSIPTRAKDLQRKVGHRKFTESHFFSGPFHSFTVR